MVKEKRDNGANLAARNAALKGRPLCTPPVRTEEKDGKLYVTVRFIRPRWQRILGSDETCERSFGLDTYGRTVYESCDGKRSVKKIIERFAAKVHVSIPEAEMAVTKFMKTLLTKGLIIMEMDQ
ncbi:MAG: PqqD family protein [Kiritimatiellia bacterium]